MYMALYICCTGPPGGHGGVGEDVQQCVALVGLGDLAVSLATTR
jgi:hypothetical protein